MIQDIRYLTGKKKVSHREIPVGDVGRLTLSGERHGVHGAVGSDSGGDGLSGGRIGGDAGGGGGLGLQVGDVVHNQVHAPVDGLAVLLIHVGLAVVGDGDEGALGHVGPRALTHGSGQELLDGQELGLALLVGAGLEVVLYGDGGLHLHGTVMIGEEDGLTGQAAGEDTRVSSVSHVELPPDDKNFIEVKRNFRI